MTLSKREQIKRKLLKLGLEARINQLNEEREELLQIRESLDTNEERAKKIKKIRNYIPWQHKPENAAKVTAWKKAMKAGQKKVALRKKI